MGVGADTLTCRADAPALRSLVGSLRYELQQAADVLESGASSIGDAKELRRRDAFLLAMHQEPSEARTLSQECIALLAASRGHLDAVLAKGASAGTAEGRDTIEGLLTFVEKEAGEIARSIFALVEEGRQVVYLTSRPAELASFEQAAKELGLEAPHVLDLSQARGLGARVERAEELNYELTPRLPSPGSLTAEEYGVQLSVPLPAPDQPIGALHLFYLLREDPESLELLRERGRREIRPRLARVPPWPANPVVTT